MIAAVDKRATALVVSAAVVLTAVLAPRLAPLDAPEARGPVPGTIVLDAHGVLLSRDISEGVRIPVPLEAVAPIMRRATVSAEDRRFWTHPGIDPLAMGRAAMSLGSSPSGASTITQQLARRLYLADDAAPLAVRKAKEALVALALEGQRSKEQILALYLNDVYYGRAAYGIEAASRVYFGISAGDLDLAHAAYLAGLPQRPSAYDPEVDPGPALERQRYVLGRLADDGVITRAEADAAARMDLRLLPAAPAAVAPAFVDRAVAELARVRPDLAGRKGLIVETTLDAGLQVEAERVARMDLRDIKARNVTDAAVVAIEPATGRILALIGGATDGDPRHGGWIDMTTAPRQPGSALKPFLYAAAFERGYTPASSLLDVPTSFLTERGVYAPLNYDRTFHGPVSLRTALASSLNIPAVRTLDAIGVDSMLEIAHRFGLRTLTAAESYGLSLTLGGGEVPLLDLTSAYAALAASGRLAEPYAVERVRDAAGRVLYQHAAVAARTVLSPQHAYLLADILSDASARVPGFGDASPFDLAFPAAVKSGTSTSYRDNWTVGYTPEIAVGVWVGNASGAPMVDVSGVEGAAPIWRDVMTAAALGRRMTWYAPPPGIVTATICAPTGLLPGADCPSPTEEIFATGTVPLEHERYWVRLADGRTAIDPPAEARAWATDAGFALAAATSLGDPIRIVTPTPGSVFVVSPELSGQQFVARATVGGGVRSVTFEVDGQPVAVIDGGRPAVALVPLLAGAHTLVAVASLADGTTVVVRSSYEVRSR
jgi:penicillin-binding protein 1C